jgi:hypothetical protein
VKILVVLYLTVKKGPGRPRIYDDCATRKRAERARAKMAGCKAILLSSVPEEYKAIFNNFCEANKLSQVEGFCYLLDLYHDFSDSNPQEPTERDIK